MNDQSVAAIKQACAALGQVPRIALQLGSGLNSIAEHLDQATVLSYSEIPGFPQPTVAGHAGRLHAGMLAGVPVLCLQGRVHFYEGQGFAPTRAMIRALRQAGVDTLLLTNAAGSLQRKMPPGSLMLLSDHINFSGGNPLIGPNDDRVGPRFLDMSEAYHPLVREYFRQAAQQRGLQLHEGVYLMTSGPTFETPAEINAYRTLGADAVGMSTAPECIVANHAGMRVAAVSTITNLAAGMSDSPLSHEETEREGKAAAGRLRQLLESAISLIHAAG